MDRKQPYKVEPGESIRPGIYEIQTFKDASGPDWPMIVKLIVFFAFVISARWVVPAFVEWVRPKG